MMNKAKQRLVSVLVLLAMLVGMVAPTAAATDGVDSRTVIGTVSVFNYKIGGEISLFETITNSTTVNDLTNWSGDVYELDWQQSIEFYGKWHSKVADYFISFNNNKYQAMLDMLKAIDPSNPTEKDVDTIHNTMAALSASDRKFIQDAYREALSEYKDHRVSKSALVKAGYFYYSAEFYPTSGSSSGSGSSAGTVAVVVGAGAVAVVGGGIVAAVYFPASGIGQAVLKLGEKLGLVAEGTAAQAMAEAAYAAEYSYEAYRAANADLVAAFGENRAAYLEHWLRCGKAEGRVAR